MQERKIKLFSDSTCDLSPELIKAMDITIVPLYVHFGEKQYKDGVDLSQKDLYTLVEQYGALPKTSAPSPIDYEEAFRPTIEANYDILCITLSSKMSSSFQNAKLASHEFTYGRIAVVDSLNLSTGIGLQVCAAYDMKEEGLALEVIESRLHEIRTKIKTAFTIETLTYLHKGGRCNAVQALLGGMLHLMPIIKVVEGEMIVGSKVRGKKQKALDYMIDEALPDKDRLLHGRMFITYTSGSEGEADIMEATLHAQIPGITVHKTYAGCVVASHCGKKTIGLLYIADAR